MITIRIGSRGSDLALWQANHVKRQLEELGAEVTITIIKTKGDQIQNLSFDKIEGKGFFTKEIEEALLAKTIDLAVHSHKDLETTPPDGLMIAAVSERENPADVLLIHPRAVDTSGKWNLTKGAVVGTSSARRKALVRFHREDAEIKDLRGNVPTRLQKLLDGEYDAILLAKAGLDRLQLDLSGVHVEVLEPTEFVPAPAQGVLALQIRSGEQELADFIGQINHPEVQQKIAIERGVLNRMDGGCQLPLGVYCDDNGTVHVAYAPASDDYMSLFTFEDFEVDEAEMIDTVIETITRDDEHDEA